MSRYWRWRARTGVRRSIFRLRKEDAHERRTKLHPYPARAPAPAGAGAELELRADQRVRGAARAGAVAERSPSGRETLARPRPLRPRGDQGAERDPPARIPPHSASDSRVIAEKHPDARS